MTKRTSAMFIALVVLTALALTACGAQKPLTPQEYYEESYRCFKEYIGGTVEFAALAPEWRFGNDEDIAAMKSLIERREKAFDDYEKLVPPEKYKDIHERILKSLEYERDWDNAAAKYETAESGEDLDEIGKEIEKIVGDESKEYFPTVYMELVQSLNKEPGIVSPSARSQ